MISQMLTRTVVQLNVKSLFQPRIVKYLINPSCMCSTATISKNDFNAPVWKDNISEDWSRQILECLKKDFCFNDSTIISLFPSEDDNDVIEELLGNGARVLQCKHPTGIEKENVDQYEGRFHSVNCHPFTRDGMSFINHAFEFISKESICNPGTWRTGESDVKVFGMFPSKFIQNRVLASWIHHLVNKNGIFSFGRVPHYMVINDYEKMLMFDAKRISEDIDNKIAISHLRWRCLFYEYCTDRTVLIKLPKVKLTGKIKRRFATKAEKRYEKIVDYDQFFFVKVVPKSDLFDRVPPDCLMDMLSLAKQLKSASPERLIPYFEKYLPGIGLPLIEADYTMGNTIRDIDLFKFPEFFQIIRNHPYFEDSVLHGLPLSAPRRWELTDEQLHRKLSFLD